MILIVALRSRVATNTKREMLRIKRFQISYKHLCTFPFRCLSCIRHCSVLTMSFSVVGFCGVMPNSHGKKDDCLDPRGSDLGAPVAPSSTLARMKWLEWISSLLI